MLGKDFAKEYIELIQQEDFLTFCIDILSEVEEEERTITGIKAIIEAREKIRSRIDEMDNFEIVKRIS